MVLMTIVHKQTSSESNTPSLILVQLSFMMNKGAVSSHVGWMRETSELHACCCCANNNNSGFYGSSKHTSGDYATNVSTEQV